MRFRWTVLPVAVAPLRKTPYCVFPEITFPAPAAVPPIVLEARLDLHAVRAVGDRASPGGVGADVVPAHHVVAAGGAQDEHAVLVVAGDDVALGRRRAADGVAARADADVHAVLAVAAVDRAGDVGADVVADDDVVGRAGRVDHDAVARVARDHVAVAASVPPMVLFDEPLSRSIPSSPLPKPAVAVPAAFVPM